MSAHEFTRRGLLKSAALAGTAAMTARSYAATPGANERLNMALVGCGSIAGSQHLPALLAMREEERLGILAVCDVYETRAKEFQDKIRSAGGDAKIVRDYRDVLAIKDVDYVTFATPEHWHARQCLDALEAGKHVYVEKPLAHTIEEAQAVVAKVKQTGLKLQVGVQGMSSDSYAAANEAIRAGKLGPVIQAQIEYCRNYGRDEAPWRKGIDANMPKPDDLDWESWLGPAPKRPWSPPRYFEWRNYRDYSGGVATDLFVHRITRIIRACGLKDPVRVAGMGGIYLWPDGRDLPDNFEMLVEYPAMEGITPGMTVHVLGTMANRRTIEHCIRGWDATLIFNGNGWQIATEGKGGKVIETYTKKGGEDVGLHHKNHHAAIRDNAPLNCPVELGLYGVIPVALANQSWFEHKMMTWDAQRKAVVQA
jgi:predicted dehydrogenase